ncbi:MAG: flagellar export chaperone FliS [Pseudomonadota bacterium]
MPTSPKELRNLADKSVNTQTQGRALLNSATEQYRKLNVQTSLVSATPHQLVAMLFDGAQERLNQARGHIMHGNHAGRSQALNGVVEIVGGLQASLDHEKGGELAGNLEALYDYMQRRLFRANADDDLQAVEEVIELVSVLQEAWQNMDISDVMAV